MSFDVSTVYTFLSVNLCSIVNKMIDLLFVIAQNVVASWFLYGQKNRFNSQKYTANALLLQCQNNNNK